jgi:2'-5' RNA ligase
MEKTFNPDHIKFSEMKDFERQAHIDFIYKGWLRHMADIKQIESDLEHAKWKYGIEPRDIYHDWIEVTE